MSGTDVLLTRDQSITLRGASYKSKPMDFFEGPSRSQQGAGDWASEWWAVTAGGFFVRRAVVKEGTNERV